MRNSGWVAFAALLAFFVVAVVGDEIWWMIRRLSYKADRWCLYIILVGMGYVVGSLRR